MIKAVLIDAMSTIFRFKGELTKYEILGQMIREILTKSFPAEVIKTIYEQKRKEYEPASGESYLEKWELMNQEVILSLFPAMEKSEARHLSKEITKIISSDSSLYEVNSDTIGFLREAKKRKIMVIVVSNQEAKHLEGLIENFGISKLLDRVYASSETGLAKPDPRFFQRVLKETGLLPKDCVMIGNNLKNDVLAPQEAGIKGILLDPRNLYPEYEGYRIKRFKDLWRLDIFH